ncbi:MAG: YraN family protein [Hyphomicrobiales bacterium]
MAKRARIVAETLGRSAEARAAAHLAAQGYAVIAQRVKTKAGEIDLIVKRGPVTAFVEVKARARLDEAAAAVTKRQATRIRNAAMVWLGTGGNGDDAGDCRFDIVLVSPYEEPVHIENAFGEELW